MKIMSPAFKYIAVRIVFSAIGGSGKSFRPVRGWHLLNKVTQFVPTCYNRISVNRSTLFCLFIPEGPAIIRGIGRGIVRIRMESLLADSTEDFARVGGSTVSDSAPLIERRACRGRDARS